MSGPPTKIDLRENQQPWEKPTEDTHRFQLQRYVGYILEAEDLQFHHDSAVFLPEYQSLEEPGPMDQDHINGVAVLRTGLLHAEENNSRKLLIVGHTDRSGRKPYNLKLSRLRAKSVLAALTGDRNTWVEVAMTKSLVKDYKVILQWINRTWGWQCDPVYINDQLNSKTERAVESFQSAYNKFFEKSIEVDGIVGQQTWGALFDVFMRELAASLETNEQGLEKYRSNIQFVDDNAKAVGVGECFPIEEIGVDGSRCAKDRRVELLWYEPTDLPQQGEYPTADSFEPNKTHIYNNWLYTYKRIKVEPIPSLVWVDLQTIDELGYRVKNVDLKLDPDQGPTIQITTDDLGYWSDRILAGNKVRVTMADGQPVRFGATLSTQMPSGDTEDTAVLVPIVGSRTITDLIVPVTDQKIIEEHRKQVNRYGRHPKNESNSVRSGGSVVKVGEQPRKTSARVKGAKDQRVTRRTFGQHAADNLFIAAGFEKEYPLDLLQEILHEWLNDHHPTAIRRGYWLNIILNNKVLLFDDSKKKLGEFNFKKEHTINGRLGAYALQQFYGVAGNIYFADMNSQTSGFTRSRPKELTKKPNEQDPAEAEKPTDAIQDEPPKRNEKNEDFSISDVVEPSEQQTYDSLVRSQAAQGKVELLYIFMEQGLRLLLAYNGGTGLLENYPGDKSMHKTIHRRNKLVAQNISVAYSVYIRYYIGQIEDISATLTKADKALGKPHPEIQLHRLGPPTSTFEFPVPIGASKQQYKDILQAYQKGQYESELTAWKAITKKLNEIRGKRTEGSIWFNVEFSAEAGNFLGPLSDASVKLNFEADPEGSKLFAIKAEKEVPLTIGTIPKSLGGTSPVKLQFKKNEETGRVDSKVNFSIGKYGVEAESNGNIKLSYAGIVEEWNQSSAIGSVGYEVSIRDMVAKSFSSKPPEWVEDLPDLKAKASIGFRLVTQGTIFKVITNSPGFFEMRPRADFASLDWATLDWDERGALEALGFDPPTKVIPPSRQRISWDNRNRPLATKNLFSRLSPQEKTAACLVPIPTSDPEWWNFWDAWEQRKIKSNK